MVHAVSTIAFPNVFAGTGDAKLLELRKASCVFPLSLSAQSRAQWFLFPQIRHVVTYLGYLSGFFLQIGTSCHDKNHHFERNDLGTFCGKNSVYTSDYAHRMLLQMTLHQSFCHLGSWKWVIPWHLQQSVLACRKKCLWGFLSILTISEFLWLPKPSDVQMSANKPHVTTYMLEQNLVASFPAFQFSGKQFQIPEFSQQ